jgi:EmrB/QacA subfamily drug resistance transporter
MVMPQALSLLNAAFPPQQRGRAMGVYGSVTGLVAALGPVVGGAVTQGVAWQWIFWINVPIAVVTIPLVLTRIPTSRVPAAPLDLPGLGLAAAAALGLVWALVRGNVAGWGSAEVVTALIAGAAATVAFVARESAPATPMLPMRLFSARGFSAGNAAIFCLNASLAGAVFFSAQFLQVGLGHDALAAGLRLLPWGIAPLLLAPRAGVLADRVGERPLVVAVLALQGAGLAWLAIVASPAVRFLALAVPMTVVGVGFALALAPLTKAVVSAVPIADIGKASGAFSTVRQLGGAFGVAILAVAFAGNGHYASASAFSDGYTRAMLVAAGLALAGALAGAALRPSRVTAPAASAPQAQPEKFSAGGVTSPAQTCPVVVTLQLGGELIDAALLAARSRGRPARRPRDPITAITHDRSDRARR